MAYEQYKEHSIGRMLHFLYKKTYQADEAIFHGNGKITLFGAPFVDSVTWDKNDIPIFEFVGKYSHFNN